MNHLILYLSFNSMLKSGKLFAVQRGVYSLPDEKRGNSLTMFNEIKSIDTQIKINPFVNYCLYVVRTCALYAPIRILSLCMSM
jgi:hypothetical protein